MEAGMRRWRKRSQEILLLGEVRAVTLVFLDGSQTTHLVPKEEVGIFVEAAKELHYKPGINPHNRVKAAPITVILVGELTFKDGFCGPYWWSTPGLAENGDLKGARCVSASGSGATTIAWSLPDNEYLERAEAERLTHDRDYR